MTLTRDDFHIGQLATYNNHLYLVTYIGTYGATITSLSDRSWRPISFFALTTDTITLSELAIPCLTLDDLAIHYPELLI